jgi:hypothetical protein
VVSEKDVVVTVIGASAGLGGFVLAFLALVIAPVMGESRPSAFDKLLDMLALVVTAFIVFLVVIAAGTFWLLVGGHTLYKGVLWLFFIGLATLVIIALYVTMGLIKHRSTSR